MRRKKVANDGRFCCTRRAPQWQRWLRCWWRGYSGFRSVLGADHDLGDHAVRTGRGARGFVGTALGAVVGAIAASYFEPHALEFACSVLLLGLICGLLRSDQASYRFGGITLAIVMLVPRAGPAWQIAFHRFAEVSIGIGVVLVLTVVWPEREVARPNRT